jgi:RNA-directed DNA polymerase
MSPDKKKKREKQPSRCRKGEGRREESGQQPGTSQRSRGVVVGGMLGSDARKSKEASCRDRKRSRIGTSPKGKAGLAARGVGVLRSSVDLWDSITHGEQREDTCSKAMKRRLGRGDGSQEIETPGKVRSLQIALYRKAQAEPGYRFWSLYGEVLRPEVLESAWKHVSGNGGAAGIDGETIAELKEAPEGIGPWLEQLREELKTKRYRPQAVRRVFIPKSKGKNGEMRPLGIPTVKDRVVQMAVYLVLMPIFEADFHPHSYGFRPKRRAHQALEAIRKELWNGRVEVIDADLSKYFDTIPHRSLLQAVARRVSDGAILRLIKSWLKAPVVEEDEKGAKPMKATRCGTPQGGVISPLLANLYLDPLDHAVNDQCAQRPVMVRYADDFVILCRPGQGQQLRERLEKWATARGLKLNAEKTKLVDIRRESFAFLGFLFNRRYTRKGKPYVHVAPTQASQVALRQRMRELFHQYSHARRTETVIAEANLVLRGWSGYFRYGNCTQVMARARFDVHRRVQRWLWKKHGQRRSKRRFFSAERLHQHYGLYEIPINAPWKES